ncbi:histone-lysine N-methyltransferase SETDB1-A isoform X2 [Stigmatopora argus]
MQHFAGANGKVEDTSSVAAYEAIVKKQYTLLGWEYRDIDDDEDLIEISDGTPTYSPPNSDLDFCNSPSTSGVHIATDDSNSTDGQVISKQESNVALNNLSVNKIQILSPKCFENPSGNMEEVKKRGSKKRPKIRYAEQPKASDDSDSDFYPSNSDSDSDYIPEPSSPKKRRVSKKCWSEIQVTNKSNPPANAMTNVAKKSEDKTNPKPNEALGSTKNVDTHSSSGPINPVKTETVGKTKETAPTHTEPSTVCIISSCSQSPVLSSKEPSEVFHAEILVNTKVLAKREEMSWEFGRVKQILEKDGVLKYAVLFKDDTEYFVPAHHLAFRKTPKLQNMYVGARVVVAQKTENLFQPAILAELPTRKNHQRFLVFIDDQTSLYVGLPCLHLVCKPLENPMEDIANASHRKFVEEYLKVWPCPPIAHCKFGQCLNVELDGVQQKCMVQMLDGNLIQVLFVECQRKEWVYRGSWRLEHMAKMKELQVGS